MTDPEIETELVDHVMKFCPCPKASHPTSQRRKVKPGKAVCFILSYFALYKN